MKIFKTKIYRVTYDNDPGGFDHVPGSYLLDRPGLMEAIKRGTVQVKRVS